MHPGAGIKPSFMGNCKQLLCASRGTIPIYKSPAEAVSKGGAKLSSTFCFLFLLCLSPIFSSFLSLSPPSLPPSLLSQGLAEMGAVFLMRATASVWALLSMQLHEPLVIRHRSLHELLLSAFSNNRKERWVKKREKNNKNKKNKALFAISPGYNRLLLQCREKKRIKSTGLCGAWCSSSLRSPPWEVARDTLPLLPTHFLPLLPALANTAATAALPKTQ